MRRLLAPISVVLLCCGPVYAVEYGMKIGQAFPDIPLPTIEGEGLKSVSSFRGQKIFLQVFASW